MFTRILVLAWADTLIVYAVWLLMIYLTGVWKLTFTHAAAILNVYSGLTAILCLPVQFIVDTLSGNYWMLVLSSLVYCTGMGFLTMSTPPVLAASTGTCSSYSPECIGDTQHILFYISLALIAVGIAGHATSLANFLAEQLLDALENLSFGSILVANAGNIATFLLTAAAVLGFPYIKPWSLKFGIPTIGLLVATLIFLSGSSTFNRVKAQGSSFTMVFRVFVASASKLFTERPEDINQLYRMQNSQIPRTRGFRCLDRAAIILPNQSLEEQEQNRWSLCTGAEVEGTKIIICSIPIAVSFLFIGLISSLGNTYFLEQAKHMNHKVGSLRLPVTIFAWFIVVGRTYFSKLYLNLTIMLFGSNAKTLTTVGIASSMTVATLCCVTAASVESRRLDAVNSHGLIDKPDAEVPLSMFWLLPQFILVGALEGICENTIAIFFNTFCTLNLTRYMLLFGGVVNGLGCIGSILSVHITGLVSERGGKPSWFQDTLNKSRLDNYYWFLSCVCAVNLGLFLVMKFCYACFPTAEERGYSQEAECCGCY